MTETEPEPCAVRGLPALRDDFETKKPDRSFTPICWVVNVESLNMRPPCRAILRIDGVANDVPKEPLRGDSVCAAEIPLLGGGLQGLLVFRAQESSFYALRGGYVLQGAEE